MALIDRVEFCKTYEISAAYLKVNIDRKKIILTGNVIDSKLPENSDWIKKRVAKLEEEARQAGEKGTNTSTSIQETKASDQKSTVKITTTPRSTNNGPSKYDKEEDLLELEIESQKLKNEQLRLKNEKLTGEMIPTELVRNLFIHHTKSIITEFKNGGELLIKILASKKDFTLEEQTELRAELKDIINKSTNKAVDETEGTLENIISEYQNKKDQGERS